LVNLTLALVELGRFSEAIARGEQAVQLEPNLAEARFNLALALRGAGRTAAAREQYLIARRLKPALQTVPDLEPPR
jgi:Flp pilus assembly protein TadD